MFLIKIAQKDHATGQGRTLGRLPPVSATKQGSEKTGSEYGYAEPGKYEAAQALSQIPNSANITHQRSGRLGRPLCYLITSQRLPLPAADLRRYAS
jgi:hypothetical protein